MQDLLCPDPMSAQEGTPRFTPEHPGGTVGSCSWLKEGSELKTGDSLSEDGFTEDNYVLMSGALGHRPQKSDTIFREVGDTSSEGDEPDLVRLGGSYTSQGGPQGKGSFLKPL